MMQPEILTYQLKKKELIVSVCSQIDIMSGFLDHYVLNKIETIPQDCFDDIKQTISFAGVLTPFLPADGILAFTLSLAEKKRKIFCLFDNKLKSFVARSHIWNPAKYDEKQRLASQMVSDSKKINSVSMFDCKNDKHGHEQIEDLFQRFLDVEEKFPCRFFVRESKFVLVKAQNEISKELFAEYSDEIEENYDVIITDGNLLNKYAFSFCCGCDLSRINTMFSNISNADLDYIFEKDDEVAVECPRCGLIYKVKRNEIT